MEGDGKMKVVHQNLLLPLFSDSSDHTNTLDTESVVDQTVNTHGVIAAGADTSHVQDMGAYSKAHVLVKLRDILLDVFRDEDITKGVLISATHVEPTSVYALNETTYLVTYSFGVLADDIGCAIEKIDKWLVNQ